MKKKWIEPQILVQEFVPNEYVAACGDKNKVYKFKCTADAGTLYYYPQGDGTIDGIYRGTGKAKELGSYQPCGTQVQQMVFMMDMFIHPHTKGSFRGGIG